MEAASLEPWNRSAREALDDNELMPKENSRVKAEGHTCAWSQRTGHRRVSRKNQQMSG